MGNGEFHLAAAIKVLSYVSERAHSFSRAQDGRDLSVVCMDLTDVAVWLSRIREATAQAHRPQKGVTAFNKQMAESHARTMAVI
jgi:hypothetical protein